MNNIETLTDEELEEKISKCHKYIGPQIDRGHSSLVMSIQNTLEQLMLEQQERLQKKQHEMTKKELDKHKQSITDPLNIGEIDLPDDFNNEED